jgi:predicted DNA binding CopG/RHH family protein
MKTLKKGPKRIPKFKSEKEEARFWDTHDLSQYWDQLEEVDEMIELAPELAKRIQERMKKRMLAIRLEEWQIARTKEIAQKKGLPYQQLMRQWISKVIRQESDPKKRRAQ